MITTTRSPVFKGEKDLMQEARAAHLANVGGWFPSPDAADVRKQLATIDTAMARLQKIEAELAEAEKEKKVAIEAGDDMATAVCQARIERLRAESARGVVDEHSGQSKSRGQLSGERTNLVNRYCNGGPGEQRLKVLEAFQRLLEQGVIERLGNSQSALMADVAAEFGKVQSERMSEAAEYRRKRLAEIEG